MDPVEVNSTVGDGLNDRGVQRVLMHELGHVKGLGHSALSDIMKWNFRGQGGNSPTAADLNGADAFETPNADDIALNKLLHGIEPPKSIAEIIADVIQEAINLWRFLYILQGQIGPGLVDKITRFTVEVPSPVNGQTELQVVTLPPGWQAAYIPGEPAGAPGTSLDEDEELQSAILTFWTDDPQFGVGPGESLPFEVLSPWGPVMRRAFTNSPNADTAEFLVPVPAGEGAALQIVRAGNVPNPEVFLPGVTSGPVIGQVWDPVVDHSSFLPAALADFMLISAIPTDVPLGPPGTLLCLPPYALTLFNFTPAAPWAVPIPNEPTFVGLGLCAQAGSSPDGSSFQLTNALDLLIGLY